MIFKIVKGQRDLKIEVKYLKKKFFFKKIYLDNPNDFYVRTKFQVMDLEGKKQNIKSSVFKKISVYMNMKKTYSLSMNTDILIHYFFKIP